MRGKEILYITIHLTYKVILLQEHTVTVRRDLSDLTPHPSLLSP